MLCFSKHLYFLNLAILTVHVIIFEETLEPLSMFKALHDCEARAKWN